MGARHLLQLLIDGEATLADFNTAILGGLRQVEADLVWEAESLFRAGLIDEAIHRLKLWTEPKWQLGEVEKAYALHMLAQRAAQSPSSGDVP